METMENPFLIMADIKNACGDNMEKIGDTKPFSTNGKEKTRQNLQSIQISMRRRFIPA